MNSEGKSNLMDTDGTRSDEPVRLWFQKHTIEGRIPALDEMYRAHARRVLSPDVEVKIGTLPTEIYSGGLPEEYVRYGAFESLFSSYFVAMAAEAQENGYDAYVIGTSQDPGLQQARSLVSIPVLAYGETAFHLLASQGLRFGIVGFIPELARPISENLARSGLAGHLVGYRSLDITPTDMSAAIEGRPGCFHDAFANAARSLIADGAEVIVPGEGLPNEVLVRDEVVTVDGAAVFDPDGALLMMAELLVRARRTGVLPRTECGYWNARPNEVALGSLLCVLGPAHWVRDSRSVDGS
jgi:allantoin racemase